jgi:pimeloyl-ACP methyl ester carboxylesterase
MSGRVTIPDECRRILVVLVHGGTYDRWYWDSTHEPCRWSFVRVAAKQRVATLNVDLLGSGRSGRPRPDLLGLDVQASALEAAIRRVGEDELAVRGVDSVVVVGHSLGSAVAITHRERFDSQSALVVTGFSRRRDPANGGVSGLSRPAEDDTRFRDDTPAGYVTLAAGSRPFFYHLPTATAAMIYADERHRDVVSPADLRDLGREWEATPTSGSAPVLVAVGEHDFVYRWDDVASFADSQRSYYPDAAGLDTMVVPDTGHALALHGKGDEATRRILDWIVANST